VQLEIPGLRTVGVVGDLDRRNKFFRYERPHEMDKTMIPVVTQMTGASIRNKAFPGQRDEVFDTVPRLIQIGAEVKPV
jgi:hypothetical protein